MSDDDGILGKVVMTALVVVFMVPGLVLEPGPISEIVGIGAIATIWGFGGLFDGGGS